LLNAEDGDVFVIFDVRRYENNTLKLAELAQARGAKIVLCTDQWRSPIHRMADICLPSQIIVPSAWDSSTTTMLLLESMISAIQTLHWDTTKDRMQDLEGIFDKTKLFRKFT
ncbi:MAG: MurR/RpiR family transcriptional regulator, partial [Silicimonas sp.]|nr:MurR/RpiR family transcriptional regulator [Silicimonas sp.]